MFGGRRDAPTAPLPGYLTAISSMSPTRRQTGGRSRLLRLLRPLQLLPLAILAGMACPRTDAGERILVEVGDPWRYRRGTEEPGTDGTDGLPTLAWTRSGFDDAGWDEGPTGIGYGDGDDATILSDMRDGYWSVYARRTFSVPEPLSATRLALEIDYDDGFVAYLNGEEIARAGLAGNPPRFSAAAAEHEAGTFERFDVEVALIARGENVLAIQGHNTTLGSSDFSLRPRLLADPDDCPDADTLDAYFDPRGPQVVLTWANETDYDGIDIWRDDELLAADLPGDTTVWADDDPLLGREAEYRVVVRWAGAPCDAIAVTARAFPPKDVLLTEGDVWRFHRGVRAPPPEWTEVSFDDALWEEGPTGIGYGDDDDRTELDDMQQVAAVRDGYLTVFARRRLRIDTPSAIEELRFLAIYDDGLVLWLNGAEIGRINMPSGPVDYLTPATIAAPEPSVVRWSISPDDLIAGDNVLAVSVHNIRLTSSDLSFIPALLRVPSGSPTGVFRRGDAAADGKLNITDAVTILDRLFRGGEPSRCPDASDLDDDGRISITDAILLLRWLFQGGTAPAAPWPDCGVDPTDDDLPDCVESGC